MNKFQAESILKQVISHPAIDQNILKTNSKKSLLKLIEDNLTIEDDVLVLKSQPFSIECENVDDKHKCCFMVKVENNSLAISKFLKKGKKIQKKERRNKKIKRFFSKVKNLFNFKKYFQKLLKK